MTKQISIVGIIPARYQSTRFPGKPLAKIAGKTLIQRTYENALKSSCLDALFVATDSQEIFTHVESFGGSAIITSELCKSGTERVLEAVQKKYKDNLPDFVVNIQGDEPILSPFVIDDTINILLQDSQAVASTAVTELTEEEALSTSVNKCVIDQKSCALYFSRGLIPHGHTGGFQANSSYYKHIGLYVFKTQFLCQFNDLPDTPLQLAEDLEQLKILEHGYRMSVAVVKTENIGVDRPEDIKKVEQYL